MAEEFEWGVMPKDKLIIEDEGTFPGVRSISYITIDPEKNEGDGLNE
jgi:hypothetical protein